ncbi:MAG: hypothetical protein QXS72_05035 [Candidatus Caldarchaeum sp.]
MMILGRDVLMLATDQPSRLKDRRPTKIVSWFLVSISASLTSPRIKTTQERATSVYIQPRSLTLGRHAVR